MNQIAIFTRLLFWSWTWGVWGMLLAVPMMMAIKVICDHVARRATDPALTTRIPVRRFGGGHRRGKASSLRPVTLDSWSQLRTACAQLNRERTRIAPHASEQLRSNNAQTPLKTGHHQGPEDEARHD